MSGRKSQAVGAPEIHANLCQLKADHDKSRAGDESCHQGNQLERHQREGEDAVKSQLQEWSDPKFGVAGRARVAFIGISNLLETGPGAEPAYETDPFRKTANNFGNALRHDA